MKKALLAILALLIIAAVAFGVRTLGARDETDAVDSKEATELVQKDDDGGDDIEAGDRPKAGTYTYEGGGTESVSALGGSKHDFPKSIPVVVELDADDDCRWTSNVIYVEQHVEERIFCTKDGTVTDLGFTRKIEFFNQLQTAEYTCGEGAVRMDEEAKPGTVTTWECTQGTDATSAYRATFVGKETMTIGDEQVDTWHVKVTSKQTGKTVGSDTSEFWYTESGLPARFTANLDVKTDSVLGETRFRERLDYTLTSMVPETDEA